MVSEAWLYVTYRSDNLPSSMSSKLPSLNTGMAQARQNTSNTLEIILPQNLADKEKIKVRILLKYWGTMCPPTFCPQRK